MKYKVLIMAKWRFTDAQYYLKLVSSDYEIIPIH